ncbi:Uncharacterized protein CLAVI_000029 [Candidatus Clavichlamydia salmonicola]|uniref:SLC13 family permease n=1 Tax=Candidatus Clavichlamydia salmonicola TaxID=469812 RepID=UPI00189156F4|nr:SLC13 family permease [Candidatus Clavichlamydia salmonicola]MBF5050427.1 Uncharacterized protein [Candidatus Clavichlamydia salmonicola]
MLSFILIGLFFLGYGAIAFESVLKINKSGIALLLATVSWLLLALFKVDVFSGQFGTDLVDVAQIIFFLFAVMSIVELIDAHEGFYVIAKCFHNKSNVVLLWTIMIISFFMSAVLDNLTTLIIIASILRKMLPNKQERWFLTSMVVIAVNSGGAWTPLGDVTTTMLWINNKISTLGIIKSMFVPSLFCTLISGFIASFFVKGKQVNLTKQVGNFRVQPGGLLILMLGMGSLLMVPVWKSVLGVPPFMGTLLGLGLVWSVTDWLHSPHGSKRQHLMMPHALTRIEISSIAFFIGILLSINALSSAGILTNCANFFNRTLPGPSYVAVVIGLLSSVLDNIPLVAAVMGMYDIPKDGVFWNLIAYCAGSGGSILIIGSAAGIALMSIEKIDFLWYAKKISWIALTGYLGGFFVYTCIEKLFG